MKTIAIILAAGSGRRFGSALPKQYLQLGHQTVLEHAVDAFNSHPDIDEVAIVVAKDFEQKVAGIVRSHSEWKKVGPILTGGEQRTDSTRAALNAYASETCRLLFHDAARPLVPAAVISRVCQALQQRNAAGVAIPVTDTIVKADKGHMCGTLNRSQLKAMQTPQGFLSTTLAKAYTQSDAAGDMMQATDDCSIVARWLPKEEIALVEGAPCNMKLTGSDDLPLLERFLQQHTSEGKETGTGKGTAHPHATDPLKAHNQAHLRAMQLRLLDILKATAALCDRHHIPYWLDSGTLLGAVRHGGFIPWDDDIDICISKNDLPRLIEASRHDLPEDFYLQCPDNDPDMRLPILKVRDRHSLLVEAADDFSRKYGKGLYVDIFPMEYWPSFPDRMSRTLARGYCRANAILHSAHYYSWRSCAELFYFGLKRGLFAALWKVGAMFCKKNTYYSNTLNNSGNGNRHLHSTIFPLSEIQFEGTTFKAPNNTDLYLRDLFKDYMQLPPEEQRTGHAVFFVEKL